MYHVVTTYGTCPHCCDITMIVSVPLTIAMSTVWCRYGKMKLTPLLESEAERVALAGWVLGRLGVLLTHSECMLTSLRASYNPSARA